MCCHQHLTNRGCFYKKNSSSHAASSTGRFFHLTRYYVITQFLSCLILVSGIVSGYSMIFPSPLISSKIVWIGILLLMTFFKQETRKTGCKHEEEANPICNPYFQSFEKPYRGHNIWVLIYCPSFVTGGASVCIVVASEMPNPLLQIPFQCDVDLLLVSSYFVP
jgi:hypothetical protein